MEFSAAMANLREMFPQHSPATIERVLRENRGALNPTAAQLLRMGPRPPASDAPAPKPKPKRAAASPPAPPPPRAATVDHIFPPDFLRLPADVEWVRVSADTNSSPLQTDDDVFGDRGGRGPIPNEPMQTVEKGSFDTHGQESGWSKLKSKLMGLSPTYTPL